jgi:hypothetical protein
MDESRRRAYLERLGVSLWWSKVPLPGALSSTISFAEKVDVGEVETAPTSTLSARAILPTATVSKTEPKHPRRALSEYLNPVVQTTQKFEIRAKDEIVNKTQDAASLSLTLLPFAFCKVQLQNGFLLLVELSDVTAPGLSAEESRLLAAILQAIHTTTVGERGFGAQQIRWPLKAGQVQFATFDAARDFMRAYLAAEYQRSPFGGLLLLGNTLTKLCLDDAQEPSVVNNALKVIAGESLKALLEHPYKKAELWQQIKILRATREYEQP